MKRKIFCLTICVLCIVAALVSCGSTKCEGHVDADKNAACDNCGIPIFIIKEEVLKEEEAKDMIVSAIPENATIGDVSVVTVDKSPVLKGGEALKEQDKFTSSAGNLFQFISYNYVEQTAGEDTTDVYEDDEFKKTWALYDPFADKTVTLYETEYILSDYPHYDNVTLDTENGIILVEITDYTFDQEDDYWRNQNYTDFYTVAGTKFTSSKIDEGVTAHAYIESNRDDITYVVSDDTKYAVDVESGTVLYEADKNYFVERPTFDSKNDKFGFVEIGESVYVYDLSKWLECVYAYDIPGTLVNSSVFYLDGGKILVQGFKALPQATKNYDILESGMKYDIVYILVDVEADNKISEIEFGYLIEDIMVADDNAPVKDTVKYGIMAYPIVNREPNMDNGLLLYADASLNILAEESALLPDFVERWHLVADGILLGEVVYGEGSSVRKLYDATGKELLTLPNNAVVKDNWIKVDGKFYDFEMKLILDPADEEDTYTVYTEKDDYVLLTKDGDYYYWNASKEAPVLVAEAENEDGDTRKYLLSSFSNYFVVRTDKTVESDTTTTYSLYNADGELVLGDSEVNFSTVTLRENRDGAYYWWVALADGTVYIGK